MNILVLMGIKHCGKSTQGKRIAEQLGVPFYDTDEVVEKCTQMKVRELYTQKGEAAFKQSEVEACSYVVSQVQALSSGVTAQTNRNIRAVVATGGGICMNKEALAILHAQSTFVFLQAPEILAANRIAREAVVNKDGTVSNLPAYIAKKSPHSISEVRDIFHSFYTERVKLYMELADVTVEMLDAPVAVNTKRILDSVC